MCRRLKRFFKCFGKDKLNVLKQEHDEAISTAIAREQQIINVVLDEYLDKDEREKLLHDAQKYGFSRKKFLDIKIVFDDFNEDTVDFNVAEEIIDARNYISDHKKTSFLTKVSNIIPEEDMDDEDEIGMRGN